MKDISRILSENLRSLRRDRQLSLEALSELTEVSKTMLGQIERGESNPTMNTLWKIANGLQISFTSLIAYNHDEVQVMQGDELVPLDPEDPDYRVYALEEFNPTKNVELYLVEIEPHHEHHSPVHNAGVEESITVMLGSMEIDVNGQTYLVEERGYIHFAADQAHTYRNPTDQLLRLSVMLYYGS